jgi:YihY family inner membrane protein
MDLPRPAQQTIDAVRHHVPEPVRNLATWIRSDEALSTAASLAFFALISLPPSALIGLWIAGAVAGEARIETLGERVASMAPGDLEADNMIVGLVDVATTLGWVSVLAALWPATAYGADLARAFDRLTPTGRRPLDGIRGRVLVIVVIALLPLLVLAALLLVLFIPQLMGEELALRLAGYAVAAVAAVAAMTGFLALLYDLFSPADVGYRAALTGGAYAAGAITAISIGYAVYLRVGADFTDRYGSSAFATVILLGLWLYLTNGALLGGYKTSLLRAGVPTFEGDGEQARSEK